MGHRPKVQVKGKSFLTGSDPSLKTPAGVDQFSQPDKTKIKHRTNEFTL